MLDFLRAEWKTLIVVALATAGVYYVFQSEERRDAEQAAELAETTVEPGGRLGELAIGMPREALVDALGAPQSVEPLELELEVLRYPARGLTAWLADDRVTALELDLDVTRTAPLPADLVLPGGTDLVEDWARTQPQLGRPMSSVVDAQGRNVKRYDGLAVTLDTRDDETVPVSITLLTPLDAR